jgi:hypothetical protein
MARATGANAQILAREETTYGTAAEGDYHRFGFVSADLGAEQPLEDDDVLGQGREPMAPDRGAVDVEGKIVVPVDLRDIGFWLKLLMGAPVTGDSANFTQVYRSGAAALPSATIEIGHPGVPAYFANTGAQANSIEWIWATSGKANATIGLIAQRETRATDSRGGTPIRRPFQRFSQFRGSIKKGGERLGGVTGGKLTYSNNLDKVRTIRDDALIDGCDPLIPSVKGEITVRFADTVLMDAASAGATVALEFGWSIDADKSLVIGLPEVYLPKPKLPITGPGGVQATYAFQGGNAAGAGHVCTITLKNDVDSY